MKALMLCRMNTATLQWFFMATTLPWKVSVTTQAASLKQEYHSRGPQTMFLSHHL